MVWYGCGYGMVWVFGMGVGIWCYHGHGEVLEKLTLQKGKRIAPEFGGLISGVPWWLVKYGKNHPGWSGGFFWIPAAPLLLKPEATSFNSAYMQSRQRLEGVACYGKSEHNFMAIWRTGLEFPAALCCRGLRIYNKTLFHWTIIMGRRDRAVPRSKLTAYSGGLLCISSLCDQWPAGPALEI